MREAAGSGFPMIFSQTSHARPSRVPTDSLLLLRRARISTAVLAGVLLGAPASAQESLEPGASSISGPGLTLEECRRLALEHNLSLQAQREALAAAGYLRAAEMGVFEPEVVISAESESNDRENTIEQTISQGTSFFSEENANYAAGLEGLTPTGARYRIGWSGRDIANNLRVRATDPFREQFQTFVGITVTQPLLKDFGLSATLARVRLASADEQIARQEFRRQLMIVVGAVETAYWDLYVAQQRRRLRQESTVAAERLLEGNRARVREGKMAEIELVEAQAGLAQRRSLASEAEHRHAEAVGRLKTLFAETDEHGRQWIVNDVLPEHGSLPDLDDLLTSAVSLHPEYLVRMRRAEQENIRVAYARNQRWPQVDLTASYGRNGLGGGLPGAWDDVIHRDYESWSVGVEVRVPITLGMRKRNEVRASEAKRREALLNLKAAEVEIANSLHTAYRRVESLRLVAESYEEVATAANRLLANERARLDEGQSDSRRVLEVENQYSDAAIAAVETAGEYQKARLELELATGRLLATRGLDIVPESSAPRSWLTWR